MSSIEVTVVGTAMPTVVEQLGGIALYPWVFSAYLLTQTISIPLYGRLADLYGRRMTYIVGVFLFIAGSVLCGLSPSMELLVGARALQGAGAGVVLPLTMTIFGDLYEVSARTKLQGLFSLVWGTSSVAGPLAGGAIVLHWSWPWVFLINVPFGVVSAIVIGVFLRGRDVSGTRPRLDLVGAVLLASATLSLLVALLPESQRPGGLSPVVWLVAAGIITAAFLAVERRHPAPLVPLRLFKDRVQLAANATGVLLGVVLFGIIGYMPLYIQVVRGGTPVEAGAALIPLSFGWTMATIVAGRLVRRVGFRALVRVGCLSVGIGGLLGLLGLSLDMMSFAMVGIVLYGVGMGASISSFTVAIQERVKPHEKGIATALSQFSRSIGGAVGVAVFGALLMAVAGVELAETSETGPLQIDVVRRLSEGLKLVFTSAVAVAVVAAIVGIVLFPKMQIDAPSDE